MLRSLVGSEMCIRDRYQRRVRGSKSLRGMHLSMSPTREMAHRHPALTGAATEAVINLNMRMNSIQDRACHVPVPMVPPAQHHYDMARAELHANHQKQVDKIEAHLPEEKPVQWRVRAKDWYPGVHHMHEERDKLARELSFDSSALRSELRLAYRANPVGPRTDPPAEYRSQHFVEYCIRTKQELAGMGPRPGVPRTTVGGSEQATLPRSNMRAKLSVARGSFLPNGNKYEQRANKLPGPNSRFDILSRLSNDSGLDRETTARLYLTFRTVANASVEYARLDNNVCVNRIDFCRAVVDVKLFPTTKFANKAFELMCCKNGKAGQGGMDVDGFVLGIGLFSGVMPVGRKLEFLWDLFAENDKLEFDGLVRLFSWVYHLIGYDTEEAPQQALKFLDLCGKDDLVSKSQLVEGVPEIPQVGEKFGAALKELWVRVAKLTQLPLGDSRSMEEKIRSLEYEISIVPFREY
eukprot:TRINITY_DN18336_c0_g2_i5.p1 TRINITY_DN18336_c0_g2~~TRINITY_DN18336_c0_g2_i5.p1  ORF type:complete len:480 (-),score=142.36 TRINITY_DN18336_c0_g2_i5:201-1595(-)